MNIYATRWYLFAQLDSMMTIFGYKETRTYMHALLLYWRAAFCMAAREEADTNTYAPELSTFRQLKTTIR